MSIIHVNQIKSQILRLFQDKVFMEDVKADAANYENFLLTRCLCAYSLYFLAQASIDAAANAVVDGSDDNGIDGVYYNLNEKTFYIVQSKWIHDGTGEPENAGVKKFLSGIRDLFDLRLDRFNSKINKKTLEITQALNDPNTTYQVILVHTGINKLAEHSTRDFADLLHEMNDASEVLSLTIANQKDLHASLTASLQGEPINLDIGLKSWGKTNSPHQAFYGQVNGKEVASWWAKYRTRLFDRNLRSVLGMTDVNVEIRHTIDMMPEYFWFFNNGITVVAKKIAKTMVGGSDTDFGTFHCEAVSIVNGAQTVGTVGKYSEIKGDNLEKVFIPIRIISLEGADDKFGENITKTNNRQNKIENRDFVTLDPEQSRIKTELAIDEIEYNVIRSDTVSKAATSFDLVESTTALACASSKINLVVQLKREIGKLWDNIDKAPYKELFNPTISGMYLWRCIRLQRKVDESLDMILRKTTSLAGRSYSIGIHGNRILSALVFGSFQPSKFHEPKFAFDELFAGNNVYDNTLNYFEILKKVIEESYQNAIIPTLFKNMSKCSEIFKTIKAMDSES